MEAAGAAIRPHFRSGLAAERKSDSSPVTLADRDAEQAMRAILSRAFPSYGLVGEEFGSERPAASFCWVLDPIDGTRAFITGRPSFGTLLALLRDGEPILGIMDQPVTGERWIGRTGQDTVFSGRFGGVPRTRACHDVSQAELSCTSPDMLGTHAAAWQRLASRTARVSWGGDCYAYGLLALGQIDIVAECNLKLWDWAALLPIVEGGGGVLRGWDGGRLTPDCDGRVLALGDPTLLSAASSLLLGGMQEAG